MSPLSPFAEARAYAGAKLRDVRGIRLAARFGDPAAEYDAARSGAVLLDRSDRGLLAVHGRDARAWLHNLVTNAVRTLDDGAGNYAFACNVKGRVLFDLNVLAVGDGLWLDLDRATIPAARAHFDRHLFTEEVRFTDLTGQTARLGCTGPRCVELARELGVPHFAALPALAHVGLSEEVRFGRHDFAGGPGFELVVPRGTAAAWWDRLAAAGATPAGYDMLDVLRIEAGLPWLGRDIDETVLPPETGQVERGVSYQKGCYLGQEVLERMRAHGALARRLVRLAMDDGRDVVLPAPLIQAGADVGRITSLVPHPRTARWIGLGYVRTTVTSVADIVVGAPPRAVTVLSG